MVVVRGVNVYPSAVEEILRSAGGVAEYRVRISRDDALVEMSVEVEPDGEDDNGLPKRLANLFQESLALRVPVKTRRARNPPPLRVESQAVDG